jgi:hypothetical protein
MSYEKEALLAELVEQHRPNMERDPFAVNGEQYLIGCRACDCTTSKIVQPGTDPVPACRFWRRALDLGLVDDPEGRYGE